MKTNRYRVTPDCLNIIAADENIKLVAYLCPSNILTIGAGHVLLPKFDSDKFNISAAFLTRIIDQCQALRKVTPEAQQLLKITRSQALDMLSEDANRTALFVSSITHVALNQHQFDALVSLVFNIGDGNYATSTLRKRLNSGDYAGAAAQFAVWNKGEVDGEKTVLPGLVTRRAAERALFLKPV